MPYASASSGSQTPPAASQNSHESTAGEISSHIRRTETVGQTPPSAAFAPEFPSSEIGGRIHCGRWDNAENEEKETRRGSSEILSHGFCETAGRWGRISSSTSGRKLTLKHGGSAGNALNPGANSLIPCRNLFQAIVVQVPDTSGRCTGAALPCPELSLEGCAPCPQDRSALGLKPRSFPFWNVIRTK